VSPILLSHSTGKSLQHYGPIGKSQCSKNRPQILLWNLFFGAVLAIAAVPLQNDTVAMGLLIKWAV